VPVNAFPAAGDYYKAVQAPSRCFSVPKLQAAEFVWDSLGPTLARGSSAVVFQASVEGRVQALRCYIREDASSRDRYSALDAYLAGRNLSPYVSGTTWLDGAITVNRSSWPVLTMDWIDGRTLNEYVDFLVTGSNAAALTTLAGRWRELVALLQRSEFAHGDLQHGNVMVDQDGQLRLVDFDGVWIPQLAGQSPPTEFGHPNYQHPLHHNWDRWLDTFSALVIYTSLVALSKDPGLWLALYNSKNLLFAKTDFFPPFKTEAWKQLAALGDPQVDELARKLQECCDPLWLSNRSLEATLEQPAAAPAPPPVPADQRWWEQRLAPGAGIPAQGTPAPRTAAPGTPAPGTPVPASSSRPRPQQAPPPTWSAAPQAGAAPGLAAAPPVGPKGSLPAPPPLSAPLGMAGTGPMPQLSQRMMPPSDTIWWTLPPAGQAQGPVGPGYHGSAPSAPMPRGYAPHAPVPTPPGPPMPGSPFPGSNAPAKRTQTSPAIGAVVLALGILLLVIGAASHISVVVIGGLVAGAWGMWRLVAASGKGSGPPR
jgi:eukaryotic-like serine/threonine-protein kinase